jgi:hypothetical protein
MACSAPILARISDSVAFSTWKSSTITALNSVATATELKQTTSATLESIESDIANTLKCTQDSLVSLKSAPSDITSLQTTYMQMQGELKTAMEDVKTAKDRTQLLTNPETKTSKYEGWFPIYRPLQTMSLLLLLGFSLFFITFFFGLLMRQLGFFVQIGYDVPLFLQPRPGSSTPMSPFVMAICAALVVTTALTIYAFTR